MGTTFKIDASVMSSKGTIRSKNEDNFYLNGIIRKLNSQQDPQRFSTESWGNRFVFAVCDGMGGEQFGEEASFIAVQSLHAFCEANLQSIDKASDLKKYMDDYINKTNQAIYEYSLKLGSRSGTTLAAVAFCQDKAMAFNIGDSSVYLLRNSNLTKLTTDHTEAQRLIRLGLLNSHTAKHHKSKNLLTRYLGSDPANGIMEADYSDELTLLKGDVYLICSDGLSDSLTDEEIKFHLSMPDNSALICQDLVGLALSNSSKDNVTALVVKIIDML